MELLLLLGAAFLLLRRATAGGPSASIAAPGGSAVAAPVAPIQQAIGAQLGQIESESPGTPDILGNQAESLGTNAAIGLGSTAATAAVTGVSIGAALSAAALTAGIGAAVFFGVEGVSNLFKCGTIGQAGCNKLDDEHLQEKGQDAIRQAMYAVETGQATPAQAANQIQSVGQQVQANYKNPRSGDSIGIVAGSDSGLPASALSTQYLQHLRMSLATFVSRCIAFLPVLQAKAEGKPYILPTPFQGAVALPSVGGTQQSSQQRKAVA